MEKELDDIISIDELSIFIELITSSTYPKSILRRRLDLLNKKETERVNNLIKNIAQSVNKIDEIISDRAEKENDPWKL
jgi:hypothetical protein